MKTWKIPVCWTMKATIEVEADTLAKAIELAKYEDGLFPFEETGPENGEMIESSWQAGYYLDESQIRENYNDNQMDEI